MMQITAALMLVLASLGSGANPVVEPVRTGAATVGDLRSLFGHELFFQIFETTFVEDFCLYLEVVYRRDGEQRQEHVTGKCNAAGTYRIQISLPELRGGRRGLSFGLENVQTGTSHSGISHLPELGVFGGHAVDQRSPELAVGVAKVLMITDITEVDPEAKVYRPLHEHQLELSLRLEPNPSGLKGSAPRDGG